MSSASSTRKERQQKRALLVWNAVAALLHALSFAGVLVIALVLNITFTPELTTDFVDASGGYPGTVTLRSLGTYQIIWLLVAFPAITALFHATIVWVRAVRIVYFLNVFQLERNPIRWIEYSITASIMTWVIMQMSGITNLFLLIAGGVLLNVALQYQGYYMEMLNPPSRSRVNWAPTLIGWLLFMGQWTVIGVYFFATVSSAVPDVPWFVWAIIIALFFQYATFGVVQLCHYWKWPRFLATGYGVEQAFVFLSLLSKLTLTWFLVGGLLQSGLF